MIRLQRDAQKTWCYQTTPAGDEILVATRCETSGSICWHTQDLDVRWRVQRALPPFYRPETTRKTRIR